MKKILFTLSLVFISLASIAQNLDSLYALWIDGTQADSTRVKAYKDYVWNGFLFSKPDTAIVLAEVLHTYAKKHDYLEASGEGYNLQGIANSVQSNYPRALECYNKSLAIREKVADKQGVALSLNNIGIIYQFQGNDLRALEYFQKSLAIQEEIGNKQGMALSLNNIGIIYNDLNNDPSAIEYYEKSLAIQEEIGNKQGKASSLSNIAIIYQKQRKYPRALEYYKKSLATYEEIGDKQGMAVSQHNLGSVYTDQKDYQRAMEYCAKSLVIREELGDKQGITMSLNNIGTIYQKQGKGPLALNYCLRALALAEEIQILDQQKVACQCLYDTYKAMGKGNEALVYMEKMRVVEDSLNKEEIGKKLQRMEFAKQVFADSLIQVEKDRVLEAKTTKTRNLLLVTAFFLLLIALGLFGRWRFTKKAKNAIEREKDKSENLLLNILPADIAKELKETGKAQARDFDNVSILFSDFKGFTEASAKLSATDLVGEINHCFEAFDGIMEKYKVEKIKTIGDAYMAASGLPVPTDDSAKNTILAALEMQAFITQRKSEMDVAGKPAFEMRVGIHTGPVVAGIVGVKKFQYDIWGDSVNTASRMESSSEVGKVNISQATYEILKNDTTFTFESRGKIEAKGKGEVDMYFVSINNRGA